MEILVLVMLYYLTQNADFEKTVKPLMNGLKDSEKLLSFINDLSKFSEMFVGGFQPKEGGRDEVKHTPPAPSSEKKEAEKQSSPADGIANDFIKELLENYFKAR